MAFVEIPQQSSQGHEKIVIGIILTFLEIFMYFIMRSTSVVEIDSIVSPFTSIAGLATFGVQIGNIIEGAWLVLVLLTIIMLIILPSVNH